MGWVFMRSFWFVWFSAKKRNGGHASKKGPLQTILFNQCWQTGMRYWPLGLVRVSNQFINQIFNLKRVKNRKWIMIYHKNLKSSSEPFRLRPFLHICIMLVSLAVEVLIQRKGCSIRWRLTSNQCWLRNGEKKWTVLNNSAFTVYVYCIMYQYIYEYVHCSIQKEEILKSQKCFDMLCMFSCTLYTKLWR